MILVSKSSRMRFPDPRSAQPDGLLCFGGELDEQTLLEAYSRGIFPWPQAGLPLLWFSPPQRGLLEFGRLHWSRRFLRALKEPNYEISFNRAFAKVIAECATVPRSHETGTWILPEMQKAYTRFHEAGYAHSVECWKSGLLVGGLYGVYVGGVFSGESMFFKESDASKRCLFFLTKRLGESGLTWMDIQMVTPVLERLGGYYVSREEFLQRLKSANSVHPLKLNW